MSNSQKKNEIAQASEAFSIDFEEANKGAMPGVTALINPEVIRQKAAAAAKKNAALKTEPTSVDVTFNEDEHTPLHITPPGVTPAEKLNPPTLESLGVKLELQFESERGFYRFKKFQTHGQKQIEAWQEKFYSQMKFDLKTVEYIGGFQEYSASSSSFHQDAFGLVEGEFVQFVRATDSAKKVYVFISENTLVPRKSFLLELCLDEKQDEGSDSFKIELA